MTDAAQHRQAKRYAAARRKRGACFACRHRERAGDAFHCRNNPTRQHPACETDGGVRFHFDPTVMGEFADGA